MKLLPQSIIDLLATQHIFNGVSCHLHAAMCLSVVTMHVMIVEVNGAIGSTLTVNYSPELHEQQQFLCLFDANISWVRR